MVASDVGRGTSWLRRRDDRLELLRVATFNDDGVRIVTQWQKNAPGSDATCAETQSQLHGGLLAALVGVDIEGEIDGARTVAQFQKLVRVEMGAQRTGDVVKARLPQHDIVE